MFSCLMQNFVGGKNLDFYLILLTMNNKLLLSSN